MDSKYNRKKRRGEWLKGPSPSFMAKASGLIKDITVSALIGVGVALAVALFSSIARQFVAELNAYYNQLAVLAIVVFVIAFIALCFRR